MLLLRQKFINREDLRANPNALYVFGDNLERQGMGGQAKFMRGEPNAFGIPTKRKMAHGTPDCYFHDRELDAWDVVEEHFNKLENMEFNCKYSAIVFPMDGIGTGLSKLPEYAPNLLKHIIYRTNQLENLI